MVIMISSIAKVTYRECISVTSYSGNVVNINTQ